MNITSVKEYDKVRYTGPTTEVFGWRGAQTLKSGTLIEVRENYTWECGCNQFSGVWKVDGVLVEVVVVRTTSCTKCPGGKHLVFTPQEWELHKSGYPKRAAKGKSSVRQVFRSFRMKIAILKERIAERFDALDLAAKLEFRKELSPQDAKIFDILMEKE